MLWNIIAMIILLLLLLLMLGIQKYTWNIYLNNCNKSFKCGLQAGFLLEVPWSITKGIHKGHQFCLYF